MAEADPYANDEHRWWSLSRPSPELLEALDEGWFGAPGRVLDLGCGLGAEAAFLAELAVRSVFSGLRFVSWRRRHIPSDTRSMPALVLRLERGSVEN